MCSVKGVAIGGREAPKFQSFVGVELQDSNVCSQGRCGRAFRVWCLSCQVVEKRILYWRPQEKHSKSLRRQWTLSMQACRLGFEKPGWLSAQTEIQAWLLCAGWAGPHS